MFVRSAVHDAVAMERALWEKPVDGGAISARGKLEAAKSQAATQLAAMRTRGAVEEFAPNPQLLEEGKVRLGAACRVALTVGGLLAEACSQRRQRQLLRLSADLQACVH